MHEGEIHGDDNDVYYSPKHPPKSTIFVANIPRKATEEELKEVFTKFGEATSVRLHMKSKGRPRGIAHIEFANREIAVAAVDSASREPIRLAGRKLRVEFANGVQDRKSIRAQPNTNDLVIVSPTYYYSANRSEQSRGLSERKKGNFVPRINSEDERRHPRMIQEVRDVVRKRVWENQPRSTPSDDPRGERPG